MESLAIFVGYLLLAMFISAALAIALSFSKRKSLRIAGIIAGLPGASLGLIMLSDAGNASTNIVVIALVPISAFLFACYRLYVMLRIGEQ